MDKDNESNSTQEKGRANIRKVYDTMLNDLIEIDDSFDSDSEFPSDLWESKIEEVANIRELLFGTEPYSMDNDVSVSKSSKKRSRTSGYDDIVWFLHVSLSLSLSLSFSIFRKIWADVVLKFPCFVIFRIEDYEDIDFPDLEQENTTSASRPTKSVYSGRLVYSLGNIFVFFTLLTQWIDDMRV